MSERARHLYEFGPFLLDTAEQRLMHNGTPIPLTPKAFETLVALVERNGHLVTKDELMKAVWSDAFVEESNLTNNVYELRKILGQSQDGLGYIETVPKRGYRFAVPVQVLSSDALVVEKRTRTRIVSEEREEEPVRLVSTDRRYTRMLLSSAAVLVAAIALYGAYRLNAHQSGDVKTPGLPFEAMDISSVTTSGNVTHAAISADGRYVANVVKETAGNSLWLKDLDAPSNVRIAGPALTEIISVVFAPAANSIYYIALDHDKGESTLHRVSVLGGPSEIVATDIYPIGFSPDGKRIAFIRMRGAASTLVVADADGSHQRVVATRQKPDFFELEWNAPAWSPDGKTIACPISFTDESGQYGTIVGVNPTDGAITPLTPHRWSYAGQPVWLPDGSGLFVSASEGAGSAMQVWNIRARDGIVRQVTHDLNDYRDLSLDRTATRLIAVQGQAVSTIWVSPRGDAISAKEVRSESRALGAVAWTPDGRLVFGSSAGGQGSDIWIMNTDGSDAKQLTVGARVDQGLAVTPDGRHILFSSGVSGGSHLWRVDRDGGNLRQITNGSGEFYPQSTPDGRWVVFQSESRIDPRVWKVPIDGGQSIQLTTTRAGKPAVSPDGRMIAYTYLDLELNPSRWGIGIISSDGGARLKRFDFPPTVVHRYVRWSLDGQSIAFVNNSGGHSDIWLQPLDGRPPRQLSDFKAEQIVAFDWLPRTRSLAFIRTVETSDAVRMQAK